MFHLAALSNKDPEAKVNNVAYLPRINDELSELDLAPVIALLITRKGWTSDRAAQAERLYRMFLRLHRGYPGQRHALPADADEVWHAHILMTAQYRRDYLAVLGRFLDHDRKRTYPTRSGRKASGCIGMSLESTSSAMRTVIELINNGFTKTDDLKTSSPALERERVLVRLPSTTSGAWRGRSGRRVRVPDGCWSRRRQG